MIYRPPIILQPRTGEFDTHALEQIRRQRKPVPRRPLSIFGPSSNVRCPRGTPLSSVPFLRRLEGLGRRQHPRLFVCRDGCWPAGLASEASHSRCQWWWKQFCPSITRLDRSSQSCEYNATRDHVALVASARGGPSARTSGLCASRSASTH